MSEIIDEDQAFADLIATIIDRRRKQVLALIPDWIAAEATHELDPNRISHPVIYFMRLAGFICGISRTVSLASSPRARPSRRARSN